MELAVKSTLQLRVGELSRVVVLALHVDCIFSKYSISPNKTHAPVIIPKSVPSLKYVLLF